MSTKKLILQTATILFNQQGTAKVSTNHIAEGAGISPGNLYYHYKDKFHIIREIYEQMILDWETSYTQVEEHNISIDNIKGFVKDNFALLWKYRFFYREAVALLNADEALSQRHTTVSAERFKRQRMLLHQATEAGILRFTNPELQMDEILTIIWIVANHYLIHLETMGQKVEQTDFETGAELILKILHL